MSKNKPQGSDAWLKWRDKGLGSSDAAVLLGVSPWKTYIQLLDEKLGLWQPEFNIYQTRAMERGKTLEPAVRKLFEAYRGEKYPDKLFEHPEYPYMRASLDGYHKKSSTSIEIKCPSKKDHAEALDNRLPEKYMPQVQWQMLVGGISQSYYVSWSGGDELLEYFHTLNNEKSKADRVKFYMSEGHLAIVQVMPDRNMQFELKNRAIKAWGLIQNLKALLEKPMRSKRKARAATKRRKTK